MCVSGGETSGPPWTWMMLSRLMPYASAWRTFGFASAPLLFGDLKLKITYGLLDAVAPRVRFGSLAAFSCGIAEAGVDTSNCMSALGELVCSCCCTDSWLCVSSMTILSTNAPRTVSVDAFHDGLRDSSIRFVASYLSTLYGPSEIRFLARSALAGT